MRKVSHQGGPTARIGSVPDAAADLGSSVVAEKNERPKAPEAAAQEQGGGALHPVEDLGPASGVQAAEASPVAEQRAPLESQDEEAKPASEAGGSRAERRLDPRFDIQPSLRIQPSGTGDDRDGERAKRAAPGRDHRG